METYKYPIWIRIFSIIVVLILFYFIEKYLPNIIWILFTLLIIAIIFSAFKRKPNAKTLAQQINFSYSSPFLFNPHLKGKYQGYNCEVDYPGMSSFNWSYLVGIGLINNISASTRIRLFNKDLIKDWIFINAKKTPKRKRPTDTKVPAFYDNYFIKTNNEQLSEKLINDNVKLKILSGDFYRLSYSGIGDSPFHFIKIDKKGVEIHLSEQIFEKETIQKLFDYGIIINNLIMRNK